MVSVTLQTDLWSESSGVLTDLETDKWAFTLPTPVSVSLQTDEWASQSLGTLPAYSPSLVACVARVQQGLAFPKFIMGGLGGSSGTTYGLFKQDTTYTFGLWRSRVFHVREPFDVVEITIPLSDQLTSGMQIVPVLYFDNEATSSVGNAISAANYPNSENYITLTPDNFNYNVRGINSFFLELQFRGGSRVGVLPKIKIDVEIIKTL